jgi:hypothetical protein
MADFSLGSVCNMPHVNSDRQRVCRHALHPRQASIEFEVILRHVMGGEAAVEFSADPAAVEPTDPAHGLGLPRNSLFWSSPISPTNSTWPNDNSGSMVLLK